MALSGSFNTNSYNGRYLVFSWVATQDSYWNTSKITWTLRSAGNSQYNYYNAGNFKVVIAGETVYKSTNRISIGTNTTIATGTKTLGHNADGSLSFSASAEAGIYYVDVNCKGSGSFTLDKIVRAARLLSTHQFTDEENLTITYNNPSGNSVTKLQAQIEDDGKVLVSRDISKTGSSYTFNFTEAERAILRAQVTNGIHTSFIINVTTTIGSNTYKSSEVRGFTIVDCEPTIAPTVIDKGSVSTQLTGNPNIMIKHYNSMYCSINATGKKGATINEYEITCGNVTKTTSSATFGYVADNTFTFTAIDSRYNSVTQTVTVPMIEYIPLTCKVDGRISLNEEDDTVADVKFTISGNYFNGSFGAVDNELIINYEIIDAEQEIGADGGEISFSDIQFNNGKYSVECVTTGLDYTTNYIINVWAEDKINTVETASKPLKAIPIFDWSEHDFNFNVPVTFEGKRLADMVIETGEEPMGSNGTWYWSKWQSGKVEAYGCRNYGNMAVDNSWGNLYRSEPFVQEFPTVFSEPPDVIDISFRNAANLGGWVAMYNDSEPTAGQTGEFIVVRPANATLQQVYISFHIIGR